MPALIVSPVTSSSGGFSVKRTTRPSASASTRPYPTGFITRAMTMVASAFLAPVILENVQQVGIGQNIAIEHDRRVVDEVLGSFESARCAARQIFMRIAHRDAILHPVAEDIGDLARLVGKAENDLGNFRPLDVIDLEKKKWNIGQRNNRLGNMQRERAQSCSFSSCEYECFDHDASGNLNIIPQQ